MRLIRLFRVTNGVAETHVLEAPRLSPTAALSRNVSLGLVPPQVRDADPMPRVSTRKITGNAPPATVAARIRYAVFLHRCGRHETARDAIDSLLRDPRLGGSASIRPMVESQIYESMRGCLEREGFFVAAVTPALLSYGCRCQFYCLQGRHKEFEQLRSPGVFDLQFVPLFRRAQVLHSMSAIRAVVDRHLEALPNLDINRFRDALTELGLGESSSAHRFPDTDAVSVNTYQSICSSAATSDDNVPAPPTMRV